MPYLNLGHMTIREREVIGMLAGQLPRVLGFVIYREHQDGASVEELSTALNLPSSWVEERIEAVRLCLERQVRVEVRPTPRSVRAARTSAVSGASSLNTGLNTASRRRRRSR